MALLAEELVEEWLNRQGYFTIRGVKVGVDEIDLLAVRFGEDGHIDCRHVEVQASIRPISYISKMPKDLLTPGQGRTSARKRSPEILEAGVKEWVHGKFHKPRKTAMISSLLPREWSRELVVNNVKYESELDLVAAEGIRVMRLRSIIRDLNETRFLVQSASGADFADLISIASQAVDERAR